MEGRGRCWEGFPLIHCGMKTYHFGGKNLVAASSYDKVFAKICRLKKKGYISFLYKVFER